MPESSEKLFAKLRKVVDEPDCQEAQEIVREAEEAIARGAGIDFTDTLRHTKPVPRESTHAVANEVNRVSVSTSTDWYRDHESKKEAEEDRRAGRIKDSDIVTES